MLAHRIAILAAALVVAGAAAFAQPASPGAPALPPLVLVIPGRGPLNVAADDLAKLPATPITTSFLTEHGTRTGSFSGPLLWAVLTQFGAVDAEKHRDAVHQALLITGQDGYVAVLAMAEIAPEFEGKQAILATTADGKPLDGHLRLVVPADRRGGRSVRDVVRIEIVSPEAAHP